MSSRPLSILYLIENCGHGGAEAQVALHASRVCALGHQALVAVPGSGWLTEELARRGVPWHSLSVRRGNVALAHWTREIMHLVRANRVSIIQSYLLQMNLCGALAGKLAGIPVVASVRGRAYDLERRHRLWAYHLAARAGVTFTTPSADLRAALVRSARIPDTQVIAIHNGVDLERLQRAFACPATDLPDGFRVGVVGRLDAIKGLEHFIAAAAIVARQAPDVRFLLVGEGPRRASLEEQARDLGIAERVTFTGYREDAASVLPALHIFAQPSLSEGLSNSLLEAMAAGRPIVATDIGPNAEVVIHRGSALLVPPADPCALAEAMLEIYRNPALGNELGAAARARVERDFSLARAVECYLGLYRALLDGRGAARWEDPPVGQTSAPERL